MQRLPISLAMGGVLLSTLYLWQPRGGELAPQQLELQLRVFDTAGYPLAGAEIVHMQELQQEVLGVSDAFGRWHGQLSFARDNTLELQIKKETAAGRWLAQRSYRSGQGKLQDSVRLHVAPRPAIPRPGHVRLDLPTPFLRRALHAWCRRAGIWVAADGERTLMVHDDRHGQLLVSLATAAADLFSFRVTYEVRDSSATLHKILRGIYAHTVRSYTAWYEEETGRWQVYNPAGFWQLRSDAVLRDARGRRFYPHPQTGHEQRQLVLDTEDESVCAQRECVVHSAHTKQEVY